MITLTGVKPLSKQLLILGRFHQKASTTLRRKTGNYRGVARGTVKRVVYGNSPNPKYPRSGNMLAATDVLNEKTVPGESTGDAVITYVFMNPEKATRKFRYQYRSSEGPVDPQGLLSYNTIMGNGGFMFYPSYVRRGIVFKRSMPKRDFVAGWRQDLEPVYIADMAQAVSRFR